MAEGGGHGEGGRYPVLRNQRGVQGDMTPFYHTLQTGAGFVQEVDNSNTAPYITEYDFYRQSFVSTPEQSDDLDDTMYTRTMASYTPIGHRQPPNPVVPSALPPISNSVMMQGTRQFQDIQPGNRSAPNGQYRNGQFCSTEFRDTSSQGNRFWDGASHSEWAQAGQYPGTQFRGDHSRNAEGRVTEGATSQCRGTACDTAQWRGAEGGLPEWRSTEGRTSQFSGAARQFVEGRGAKERTSKSKGATGINRQMRNKAIKNSKDKICSICLDTVLRKPFGKRQFGILDNCNHCFCLECIKRWRKSTDFDNRVVKSCPECRTVSDILYPSLYWMETQEAKDAVIGKYKKYLSVRHCRYYNRGHGVCMHGNTCHYRHALPDGTDVDIGPPIDPPVRRNNPPEEEVAALLQHLIALETEDDHYWYTINNGFEDFVHLFFDSDDSD